MKDVVIVTGSMVRGGAEGVVASVANGLAQRGWKVHIISILFDICDYELDESVEYINISNEKKNQMLDTPRLVLTLRKQIKRIKPQAVLSFMVAVNIVTWMATRELGIKFIPSERNDPEKGRSSLIKKLQAKAYGAATTTVFQTSRAQKYFSEDIQKHSVIIPNPVKQMPEAAENKTKRIVTAGRLSEQKDHKLLIDAFAEIHKDHPDFGVDIYGEGSLRDELQKYIDERSLTDAVVLQGKINNVPERIKDAYMFVLPSDYEGLSNALLEAMAIGLPCITTNCAGSDDAIQNGINGLIVPVGGKDEMVAAMRKLIDEPETATSMGRKARESASRYSLESIVDQWEDLIPKK